MQKSSVSSNTDDKYTYYRYDVFGNRTLVAQKGPASADYTPNYYPDNGDHITLYKYNNNSQLCATIKFNYPSIPNTVVGDTDFLNANLAATTNYIIANNPDIYYISYNYLNGKSLSQRVIKGVRNLFS